MDKNKHMKKRLFITGCAILFTWLAGNAYAQVEHNYHVVSGFTGCDSLDLKGLEKQQSIKILQETRFRYQQEFRLTRPQGLKRGAYYSCDGRKGYLVVTYDDRNYLYSDVPLQVWEKLITSSDPQEYFLKNIKNVFQRGAQ